MSIRRLLLPVLVTCIAAGCDSSSEFEQCTEPNDAPGSHRDACPVSVFNTEDVRGREVSGLVRRGEDAVPGATVRVDATPGFAAANAAAAAATVTDAVGVFGGLRTIAFRYDLSVLLDRPEAQHQDVMFFHGLANRYFEPSLDGPRTFARAWTSHVDVKLDRPIASDHSVAFFAAGNNVYTVKGDLAGGLTFFARDYSLPATLHVIEYPTAGGFEKATAYGKVDFQLNAGSTRLVNVALDKIELSAEPKFDVAAPAGFSAASIKITFGFSRTSYGVLASIPIGTSRPLSIIPNAGFSYQVVATDADGNTSDTGELGFDILVSPTAITLPSVPTLMSPLDGESRGVGETFRVAGDGIFEHVMTPQAGGPSIRLVTGDRETALPDLSKLGIAAPSGPYSWTVRSFPKSRFIEELSGVDSRRSKPMSTSRARTVVLR